MQDRYFGDVGDFGKYGLLRILCGSEGMQRLKLGVVWYLFPDERHNADGKHIGYLRGGDRDFRDCDEELYAKLRRLLCDENGGMIEGARRIANAESSGLFPQDTVFYSKPLAYPHGLSFPARLALRNEWFEGALASTVAVDLIFLDPDNGIECATAKRTGAKGPKYVFWDEIDSFVERGQSVVVYHHLNRTNSHFQQVEDKLRQMSERFGNGCESFAVTFKRGTNRAYFVVASSARKDILRDRLEQIHSGPWSRHFIRH